MNHIQNDMSERTSELAASESRNGLSNDSEVQPRTPKGRDAGQDQDDIVYPSTISFVLVHLACIAAIWTGITWQSVVLCAALYWLRIFFIGAGHHRYFSRS